MMSLPADIAERVMYDKLTYDSLSQAIKLAKLNDCPSSEMKRLVIEKQEYHRICSEDKSLILKELSLSSNVILVDGNWYAIRYLNEKTETCLELEILKHDSLDIIRRDSRYERELTKDELFRILPDIVDSDEVEVYKSKVASKSKELLLDFTGIRIDGENESDPVQDTSIIVSSHAGMRYVQRVMKKYARNDQEAEEYRRKNADEINRLVVDGHSQSICIWEGDDGVTYWMDEDNIIYVRGMHPDADVPVIITLYPMDFGFNPEINRMITLKQVEVLQDTSSKLAEMENKVSVNERLMEEQLDAIDDNIIALEAELESLRARKEALSSSLNADHESIEAMKVKLQAEFNKLFRRKD